MFRLAQHPSSAHTSDSAIRDSITRDSATRESASAMFAKVQSELADRYVEVEVEGLTLRRLGCIYLAAVQGTRIRMLQGVRSLFHLNPAH